MSPATHRPLLTAQDLLPDGPLRRLRGQVFMHRTIDSTNQFLLERATQVSDGAVAWAEFQTAGRGRLGRRWEAPRGSSVLLSILLHEPADSPLLSQAALLAALAACEAIEAITDCSPRVRWPNDLMLAGRKVGGVLAESRALSDLPPETPPAASLRRAVVIGVGLNCLQQPGHFQGSLAGRATSLECESTGPIDRGAVTRVLLARLDYWLHVCGRRPTGWGRVRSAWRQRCEDVGTRVTLLHHARTFTGTAIEVSDDGDLVVQLDHGGRRCFPAATTTRVW